MTLNSKSDLTKVISTAAALFKTEGKDLIVGLLACADISSEMKHYDNWDGGQHYYTIYVSVPVDKFSSIQNDTETIEKLIENKIEIVNKAEEHEHVSKVVIIPEESSQINWGSVNELTNKEKLVQNIQFLKNTMISVSTGGQRIQEVNNQYQNTYGHVDKVLKRLNIHNPNPFNDLWEWYGKWSADIPKYAGRRAFISKMYSDLITTVKESDDTETYQIEVDIKGWPRIDRTVIEIKKRLRKAETEEQYQSVGHLSREAIISLAQEVFDKEKHASLDGTGPSDTDAKRMLEAYFAVTLGGSSNESTRRFSKSTLTLANELTHKRTATHKDALLCSLATTTLINIVKTIEEN